MPTGIARASDYLIAVLATVVLHVLLFFSLVVLAVWELIAAPSQVVARIPPPDVMVEIRPEMFQRVPEPPAPPENPPTRAVRTTAEQESPVAPDETNLIGERDTLAASELPPDPDGPMGPSQDGENMNSQHMIFSVLATCLITCSCNQDSDDPDSIGNSNGQDSPEQRNPSENAQIWLESIIDGVMFSRFEADDVSINEALAQIELKIRESPAIDNRMVKIRNLNSGDPHVTIVLKYPSTRTLLNLIKEQTGYDYRLDGENLQIVFFSVGDTIGDEEYESEEGSRTLPPLRTPQ